MAYTIRKAAPSDIGRLLEIYNYEVQHGVATLDLQPRTLPEWENWYQAHQTDEHLILVAETVPALAGDANNRPQSVRTGPIVSGISSRSCSDAAAQPHIAGYASLSPYREKEAYRSTVELSVYVAPEDRGSGAASTLMQAILDHARQQPGLHLVVSVITSGNEASTHLHEKFGFNYCGTIHAVGCKHGAFQNIDNYELIVGE